MTSPVTASERDPRTLLGIVSDHRTDRPPTGLPPGEAGINACSWGDIKSRR